MYLTKEKLYGNEKAKFILVKDSRKACGRKLFKTVLKLFVKDDINLRVICFDGLHSELCNYLPLPSPKIELVDCFSDPLKWNFRDQPSCDSLSVNYLTQSLADFQGVACIDSLSSLIIHNGINQVYKCIHQLLQDNSNLQILTLLHIDVHEKKENVLLDMLATTTLQLSQCGEKMLSIVRYPSGKVMETVHEFEINSNYEFGKFSDVRFQSKVPKSKKPDPTANLTFNLRLKESEIADRCQVQLPYVKTSAYQEEQTLNLNEDDFYDDEDPDDDLDI